MKKEKDDKKQGKSNDEVNGSEEKAVKKIENKEKDAIKKGEVKSGNNAEKKIPETKSTSPINKVAFGIVVAIFVLVLGFYLYYFNFGGREQMRQKLRAVLLPPSPIGKTAEEQNKEKVLKLVRENEGKYTTMSIASRLEFYRKSIEKERGDRVVIERWRVEPSINKPEDGRYYDVFHDWSINNKKTTFTWFVDLKDGKVEPSSDEAIRLENYDKLLLKSIPLSELSSVIMEESPLPKPTGEEPELKPLKPGEKEGEVTPPDESTGREPVRLTPLGPGGDSVPDPSSLSYSDDAGFELKGVMLSGDSKKALILDNAVNREVSVGSTINGWRVTAIGDDAITISNGSSTRTIRMKMSGASSGTSVSAPMTTRPAPVTGGFRSAPPSFTGGKYPKAGRYRGKGDYPRAGEYGGGAYPKAGEYAPPGQPKSATGKSSAGPGEGPPAIPPPGGEAPPIPPAPGKESVQEQPDEKPTIIPLD
ncbi:MAG: hypothetical protein K8T10_02655 [Candidatus Eremiobacteraeota bacterium]|nr:hypothetical protein [Candidatus Eremiobacteraeota bacterium]